MRAKQTAEIIAKGSKTPISLHKELSETRMGTLAGHAWEEMENGMELKKQHRTVTFDYRPYGGESVEDVKKRLIPFLKKIKNGHTDGEVLLITHGGIIRLLYYLEKGEVFYETQKHVSLVTFDIDTILKNA